MATQKNEQGLDVCHQHVKQSMEEFKCTCGSWLELRAGKFGPYFNCMNCGNMNYAKAMEIKEVTTVSSDDISKEIEVLKEKTIVKEKVVQKKYNFTEKKSKETTISTDDVEYFD